jgi:nitrate/nitrite transporter NarK
VRRGWPWTQWALLAFTGVAFAAALGMRETRASQASQLKVQGQLQAQAGQASQQEASQASAFLAVTLARPLHMLVREPIVAALSLYIALNFGVVFAFIAAFPHVFASVYAFSLEQAGLVFLSYGLGAALAVPTCILVDRALYQPRLRRCRAAGRRALAPEHRLYAAMMGAFGLRQCPGRVLSEAS